jgi:hypothetical protein
MQQLLMEMATRLEGVRLLTVTDSDCMVLASWEAPDNDVSPDAMGEFVQKIKNTISTFKHSTNGVSKLDDIVLGTPFSYVMIRPICNGSCFIVADSQRSVSLGAIRAAFNSFAPRLEQAIPGYEAIAT